MSIRFPENFVAYHADVEDRGHVFARLELMEAALPGARTATAINDLRARRTSLEWQAMLQRADDDFRARRYERALAGYRNVSRKILALLEPRVGRLRTPRVWPEGATITDALVSASAELLSHLIPEQQVTPLVLQAENVVPLDELGATEHPVVSAAAQASDDVLAVINRAAAAAEQGRWDEASTLYQTAIEGVPRDNTQMRAELMLNLGAVEIQRNETRAALRHLETAQGQFEELGDQLGVAEALHNAGLAHLRAGSGEEAVKTLGQARVVAGRASLLGLLERTEEETPRGETETRDGIGFSTATLNPVLANPAFANTTIATTTVSRPELLTSLVLTRSIVSAPVITLPDTVIAPPSRTDAGQVAASLGSFDLSLKLRSVTKNVVQNNLALETPAQEKQDNFARALTVTVDEEPITLQWSKRERLDGRVLRNTLYRGRVNSSAIAQLGFRVREETEAIANLPHLYHLVLPIKMGDCHMHLGEHEEAQSQYGRASRYDFINLTREAPDLWRRMAENVVAWGDSLYRVGRTDEALPVYDLLMGDDRLASDSLFYTTDSLEATGETVREWLQAVAEGNEPPALNPAIAHLLHTVRRRWAYILAGLDFFGNTTNIVSPFSFRYLQEVARYFAQRAITAEQRYIDFYTRFENGEMTRKDLENATELSALEVDAARERERAAAATVEAADANADLARTRRQNAQDQLNQFNSVDWELEQLAGHIARGNAWTGGDLPNLNYSAGSYHFDGPKHEVLQDLTRRQTSITNDLQRARMQDTVNEMAAAEDVAQAQQEVARAQHEAAQIETHIARARAEHADDMLNAFNEQKFNPEQWLSMATIMRWLANTALNRGIEVARLMERAYNFENFDNRQTIRDSYRLAFTDNMLGGELLLSDVDSFTHYHVTRVREKPIPVKWALSLPEQYPGQFSQFAHTGRMEFEVDISRVIAAHPGTHRHQLVGVELEVDGFLPPTGLHGRLTNAGLGRYRDRDGSVNLRLQPAETLILSRYDRRQDSLLLAPPQEMRALFEGNSVASGWTLEIPRGSNDVDLNVVFDIRLVLYFECLFDRTLFTRDTQPLPLLLQRSRSLFLRHHFPDAFYQLRETGRATIDLAAADFPRNQQQPTLRSLALAVTAADGASLDGVGLAVNHPGTNAPVNATLDARQVVPSGDLPVNGDPSALGRYEIELDPAQREHIADITLVMDYGFAPA